MDTTSTSPASPLPGQERKTKRKYEPRAMQACQMCRTKKTKCNQERPCSICADRGFDCVYARNPSQTGSRNSQKDNKQQSGHSPMSISTPELSGGRHEFSTQANTISSQSEQQAELDPVGDVNKHTSGMEFYGTSSNFALLSQLISQARSRVSEPPNEKRRKLQGPRDRISPVSGLELGDGRIARSSDPSTRTSNNESRRILEESRVSIVELLFDENSEALDSGPGSRAKTPVGSSHKDSTAKLSEGYLQSSLLENLLEREYMHIFFNNLYHIHPILSKSDFLARCEKDVWTNGSRQLVRGRQMHFLALYKTIIAVGALTAGTDLFESLRYQSWMKRSHDSNKGRKAKIPSSIDLSRIYFRQARRLLGDVFEVCSLESAQALILMSLYCQNALKPHACYMYSGMAVRTALAIGLPDDYRSKSKAALDEAKITWWAIYSQEVDMCCSSGRRSSLLAPHKYKLSLPEVKEYSPNEMTDSSTASVAMIPEMVRFASILLRTSDKIYLNEDDPPPIEKSKIALQLDAELLSWKSRLPFWLNPDSNPFREPEWAGKQKIVLQLRFYNAKILIHRPLMAASTMQDFPELEVHMRACLEAARRTIDILYECYAHRHYFRSWWYNSTYTLYASMIVLYVILVNHTSIPSSELIRDVEKSLDILVSMEDVNVARRCADLIRELLEIAKLHLNKQQARRQQDSHISTSIDPVREGEGMLPQGGDWSAFGVGPMPMMGQPDQDDTQAVPTPQSYLSGTLGTTKDHLLASIMDPVALEGFASDGNFFQALGFGPGSVGMEAGPLDMDTPFDFPSVGFDGSEPFYGNAMQGFGEQW